MDTALSKTAGNDPGKPESLSNRWYSAARRLGNVLWPHRCFVCSEDCGGGPLCGACQDSLPWMPPDVCPTCGLPSPALQVCGRCLRRPPQFDATLSVFTYAQPVREMVLSLKHGRGFGLLPWFSEQLVCCLQGQVLADCIVPMPLHRRRLAERGFNQAVELGRVLSRATDIPLLREGVVRKLETPKLAGLREKERRRALRNVFGVNTSFENRDVVVLDDVMTSGATLDELARTIKNAGARSVTNLVLARTLRTGRPNATAAS